MATANQQGTSALQLVLAWGFVPRLRPCNDGRRLYRADKPIFGEGDGFASLTIL
jgi:hypothetical protein